MVSIFKKVILFLLIILFAFSCIGRVNSNPADIAFKEGMDFLTKKKYVKAIDSFESIIFNEPLSLEAQKSFFYLAEAHYYSKDYVDAIEAYKKFIKKQMIDKTLKDNAEFMIAKSYYNLSNDTKRDQTDTYIALNKLQDAIENESMEKYYEEVLFMIVNLRNKLAKKLVSASNNFTK